MKLNHIALLALFVLFASTLIAQEAPDTTPQEQPKAEALTPPPPPSSEMPSDAVKPKTDSKHTPPGWHPSIEMRNFFQDIKKNNPEEYKRLMKLRMQDREKFFREVYHNMPRPTRESEQRIEELDKRCWKLAKQLQKTTDETEKAKLKEEISKDAAETLDLLISQTEQQIEEMNKRLKSFRDNRDKILEKKINFFLNLQPPPKKK